MGKEIVYCSVCGDRILEGDFSKGRAVTLEKKNFCPKCANTTVKKSTEKTAAIPELARSIGRRKRKTQRIPLAEKPASLSGKPAVPLPVLIAIGIGILVVILIVVVLSRSGSPG